MRVHTRSHSVGAAAGRPAFEAPLVGRNRELDELLAPLGASRREGRPRFVVIEGVAGIGKSRLLREFLEAARRKAADSAILQGRCPPIGRGMTNWPLAEVLRRAMGIGLDDPVDRVRERFHAGVLRALAPLGLTTSAVEETVNALATSAGIHLPGNPIDRLEPKVVPSAIAHAWARFLGSYDRRGGAVLAIEDLHWAGSGLVDLVASIAAKLDGTMLLIATARPGFRSAHPDFLADHDVQWLSLAPLGPVEAGELVGGLLADAALPTDVLAWIVDRAEGHPYFLEEALQLLVEAGSLRWDGGEWRLDTLARAMAVPESIQAVLAARIDSLPLDERRILQEAAVIGRVFWEGPLQRALGDADVAAYLPRLADRGLIFRRPTSSLSGEAEYTFKHALLRDAAYETMSGARRARSHAIVGTWLAELASQRTDELAELIAEHFRLAIDEDADGQAWITDPAERESIRRDAVRYLLAAGAKANSRFAIDRAVELSETAVRLAANDVERAGALAELAHAHESGLHGPEAIDAYRGAIAAAERAGLTHDERARMHLGAVRLLTLRWGAFPVHPDPAEMDAMAQAGLRLADDPETRCWLLVFKAAAGVHWIRSGRADPLTTDERLRVVATAIEGAARLGLADMQALAGRVKAQLEFADGRFADVARTMRQVAADIEAVDSVYLRALTSAYIVLSIADIEGAYHDALEHARRALELGRRLSPHEHMHGTFMMLWCLYHLGRWTEMTSLVAEHIDALRGQDAFICPYLRSGPLVGALALAHLGRHDEARHMAALVQRSEEQPGLPEALMALLDVATGSPDAAVQAAGAIVGSGRRASFEENELDALALVEALRTVEDWDGLRAFLPEARRRAASLAILVPVCDRAEAMANVAAGDTATSVALLRRAGDWFERVGVPYELARTKALLAHVLPDGDAALAEALASAEHLFGPEASPQPHPERADDTAAGSGAHAGLSPRERDILVRLAEGRTNQDVAEELVLSLRTVERHVSNIYLKLGFEGRTARAAAVSFAHRAGLAGRRPD